MVIVYRDNRFEKCLDYLKRSGGSGAHAARRAEMLIGELTRSDETGAPETRRLTRNGEARIRKCRKYDLGDGYRLICFWRRHHLVLLYAGSHDDCDRWLERNRGLSPAIDAEQPAAPASVCSDAPMAAPEIDVGPDADDDAELKGRLTEKDLRMLFSGLCGR